MIILTAAQRRIACAMPEDRGSESLDAHVRALIKHYGLDGFHHRNSIGTRRGVPDWEIWGYGKILYRELKSMRGRLTDDQRDVRHLIIRAGGDWGLWTPVHLLDGTIEAQLASIAAPRETA